MSGDKLIILLPIVIFVLFVCIHIAHHTAANLLQFVVYFLPFMDLKVTTAYYGGFTLFDLIMYVSLISFFKRFITTFSFKEGRLYFFLFVCLILIIWLGIQFSDFTGNTVLRLLKIFPIFIFGRFLITELHVDKEFFRKILKAFRLSFLFSLMFIACQMSLGLRFTWYPSLNQNTYEAGIDMFRYPGIFYEPQINGQYLAIGAFVITAKWFNGSKRSLFSFESLIVGFAVYALLKTGSRAALAGLGLGIIVVIIGMGRRYIPYLITIGALIYICLNSVSPSSLGLERVKNVSSDYDFRMSIWKEAFQISQDHPVLGIGLGNYQSFVQHYYRDQYLELEEGVFLYFDQPENGYLKILVELGSLGFITISLFFILPIAKAIKQGFIAHVNPLIVLIVAALIAWLTAFTTVFTLFDIRMQIIIAILLSLLITAFQNKNGAHE